MMKIRVSPEQAALQERREELIARLAELKGRAFRTVLTELVDAAAVQFMPKGKVDPLDSAAWEQAAATAHRSIIDFLEATIDTVQFGRPGR